MNNKPPKRFAPFIRVSTEMQERMGESLRTQKKHIIQNVKFLGGVIPKHCWKYSGAEHATPDFRQERTRFKQLLEDSGKGLFDAIIVDDLSRWSRDVYEGIESLEILKRNKIEFYTGTSKHNHYSPIDEAVKNYVTTANQFTAREQNRKSLLNKIERANRDYPTCGKLPYARTFNKKTGEWNIDREKQKKIKNIADRYIKGEGIRKLAEEIGMSHANLQKILRERCGDKLIQTFNSEDLGIHEEVKTKVPRLLPQETIDAILNRIEANKTYTHGHYKHKYLFRSMIRCGCCGHVLTGYTKRNGKQYYRHDRDSGRKCNFKKHIPDNEIGAAVLTHLFQMYSDVSNMEKAIQRAIPNREEIEKLRTRKEDYESQLKSISKKRERYHDLYADGLMDKPELEKKLSVLDERRELLDGEVERINPQLENIPTKEQIKRDANFIKLMIRRSYYSPSSLSEMSFEDKQQILRTALGGKDADGKRLGVYMEEDSKGALKYTIKGVVANISQTLPITSGTSLKYTIKDMLADIEGTLPMTLDEIQEVLRIDPRYEGDYNPFAIEPRKKKPQGKIKEKKSHNKKGKVNIVSTDQHYLCRKHH